MQKTLRVSGLVLQRGADVIGFVLNFWGAIQSTQEAGNVQPWALIALGTLLLILSMGSAIWMQHTEIERLHMAPRPNVLYVDARPAVGKIFPLDGGSAMEAQFIRAEFENRAQEFPPTAVLDRPHVRIRYYRVTDSERELIAHVREGRIVESRERFDPSNPSAGLKPASDVAVEEIRVGGSMTIDLLVRPEGSSTARTWSDDGGNIGQEPFPPGVYIAEIDINASNLGGTVHQNLCVVVPEDHLQAVTLEAVNTPQSAPSTQAAPPTATP